MGWPGDIRLRNQPAWQRLSVWARRHFGPIRDSSISHPIGSWGAVSTMAALGIGIGLFLILGSLQMFGGWTVFGCVMILTTVSWLILRRSDPAYRPFRLFASITSLAAVVCASYAFPINTWLVLATLIDPLFPNVELDLASASSIPWLPTVGLLVLAVLTLIYALAHRSKHRTGL